MKRILSLTPLVTALAFPFLSVQACGPFFSEDVFVRSLRPDHPKLFAQGKLGILLATYPRTDLAVAYRYLNGGTLTAEEQTAYEPTQSVSEYENADEAQDSTSRGIANNYSEPLGPADEWLKARNRYAAPQAEVHDVREFQQVYPAGFFLAGSYENCQPDGFHTAVATLASRAKTWGAKSAELADWIKGQDAVFSNCGGGEQLSWMKDRPVITRSAPAAVPAGAPTLLRQDRAYQVAAAQFYAGKFGDARVSFQAIAEDASSPWHGIATYLVARALVRDAFLSVPPSDGQPLAGFNSDQMKQAQKQLESIRNQHLDGISQRAIQELLNLVRLRSEPEARLRELSAAVAGPKADAYYKQDLGDLTWYLNAKLNGLPIRENADDFSFHIDRPNGDYKALTWEEKQPGFNKAYGDVAGLRAISPLIDWVITFQSPAERAKEHATAEWRRTGSTAWLLAALAKASSTDTDAAELIEAAQRVPQNSPAWLTAAYHRQRLLMGKDVKASRAQTDAPLKAAEDEGNKSAANLLHGQRMLTATTLDEALADAPRTILERTSEEQSSVDECLYVMKNPKRHYDCADPKSAVEFSADATTLLNNQLPVAMLARAAQSRALPQPLRRSIAMMTWVRAVMLQNKAVASQVFGLLPEKLREEAGPGTGFGPQLAILRNPGLRPYLDPGVQRSYSYDFVESYSDNWWCADWKSEYYTGRHPQAALPAAFLSAKDETEAAGEMKQLHALGGADEYLAMQVVDHAKVHPAAKEVPESLYLTLRMVRYGCYRGDASEKPSADRADTAAREVVSLMRHRYPANPWTKKAAPFVGLVDR